MTATDKKQIDELAKVAMQAIVTNDNVLEGISENSKNLYEDVAKESYMLADAMWKISKDISKGVKK